MDILQLQLMLLSILFLILILLVLIHLDLIPVSNVEVFFNVVAYFDCILAFWIKERFEPSSNRFWTWTEPPWTWTESSVQGSGICLNRTVSSVLGSEKCQPEPDWTKLRQPYGSPVSSGQKHDQWRPRLRSHARIPLVLQFPFILSLPLISSILSPSYLILWLNHDSFFRSFTLRFHMWLIFFYL